MQFKVQCRWESAAIIDIWCEWANKRRVTVFISFSSFIFVINLIPTTTKIFYRRLLAVCCQISRVKRRRFNKELSLFLSLFPSLVENRRMNLVSLLKREEKNASRINKFKLTANEEELELSEIYLETERSLVWFVAHGESIYTNTLDVFDVRSIIRWFAWFCDLNSMERLQFTFSHAKSHRFVCECVCVRVRVLTFEQHWKMESSNETIPVLLIY